MKTNKAVLRGNDIRQRNEKLVLRLIQNEGLLSQSEAVALTGLKAPTILRIFTNLEEAGFIEVSETPKEGTERKGRKPVYYRLNAQALYVVGVEFWSLSANIVISNFVREPVYSSSVEIGRDLDGEGVLSVVYTLIRDSLDKMKISREKLAGIGVGAPGKVDIKEGNVIYYSRINGMQNLPVAGYLEKKLGIPILVHNNCSVIALNEYSNIRKQGVDNIIALLLRGGVGGAYINGGKIITSGNITTMEVGHMSVDPDGRECSCGFRGCLETYLSEDIILRDMAEGAKALNISDLDKIIPEMSGDSGYRRVLDEKAGILAYAVKNLSHLFSPDLFLIISRSKELSDYLSERANKILADVVDKSSGRGIDIKPVFYNPLHAGMGACDIVFSDFFSEAHDWNPFSSREL